MGNIMEIKYKLVPVEPDAAQLNAARDWSRKVNGIGIGNEQAAGCYQAMLAAAPEHPTELEIVQKALSIDESCRLTILPIGAWCFYDSRSDEVYADGNDFESLLTWAKQTIEGVEG